MNILIVDDNKDIRDFLKLVLSDQGHTVWQAADGQEGLDAVREHRPDAVICDGLMPVMDGFQLLQALKRDSELASIPFIFFSAVYTGQRERERACALGADAYLDKPQQPEAIIRTLKEVTSDRTSAKEAAAPAGGDAGFAQEYSRIAASALEEKVQQLEKATRELEAIRAEIQQREADYRVLFENNPQPMWVYDSETLAFLAVNDTAVRTYGYSREEFLSMTAKDIRPADEIPDFLRFIAGQTKDKRSEVVWKHRLKDGSLIDVEVHSHAIEYAGRKARIVAVRDITGQKRLERAIRNASDEWRNTFDSMHDAVALLGPDGRIRRCNKVMTTLVNKPFSEIIGRHCWEVVHDAPGPIDGCPHEAMKKSKKSETLVLPFRSRWIEITADPLFDKNGAFLGAVHIMTDITERRLADEMLRKREAQLSESQRIAGIGSWERDLATNAVVWSKELFRIFGLDPEKTTPSIETLKGLIHPDDRDIQMRTVQEAIRTGEPYRIDFRILKRDGTTAVIHSQGEVVRDEGGRPMLLRGTAQDITERKKAEEALRSRQYFLSEAQRIAHIGSWEVDIGTGRITWSDEMYRIYGVSPDTFKITIDEFINLIHPEDRAAMQGWIKATFTGIKEKELVFRILLTDGSIRYIRGDGKLFADENGKPIRAMGTAQDITEQKKIEETLKASEEKYRDLFENANDAIFLLDSEQRFTDTNKAGEALTGYAREELLRLSVRDLIPPEQALLSEAEFEKLRTKGSYDKFSGQIRKKGGSLVDVDVSSSAIIKDGRMIGSRDIVRDITERRKTEVSVREQQRFTENLIMNSAIATFVLDAAHTVLIWNKACEELTGVAASSMVGTKDPWKAFYEHERPVLADIVLGAEPEKLSILYNSFSESTLTQDGIHAEGWYKNLNRRDRYIVFDAAPIRDGGGNVIAAIETLQDITELKRAEEAIRESEEQYRNVVENAFDLIQSIAPDGRFVYVNPAWLRTMGYSLEELRDRTIFDIIHPSCKAKCTSVFSRVAVGASIERFETQFVAKDGRVIDIEGSATSQTIDGKVVSMQCLLHDVTERKKLEEQLYSIKQDWEYTFNSITDMVTVHDADYNIILANRAAQKILHLPLLEKTKDRKCFSYYHGTDHAPEGCPSCGCLQTGVPAMFELFEPHLGMFIEIRAIPRFDSTGNLIGLIHVVRDITERKRLEQQIRTHTEQLEMVVRERTRELEDANLELQLVNKELVLRREEAEAASRSKTDFLANMSHELRTPLNAIMGFSEIMLMDMAGPITDKQREFLNDISKSGGHLLSLINDILDLSKIEAGKTELEPEVISVNELVRSSTMMFKEKALKHAIQLETTIDPAVREIVADRRKLKQVIVNLLSNAFKFTQEGGSVRVSARSIAGSNGQGAWEELNPSLTRDADFIEISVADTGIGISREHQQKLFQPFQQIDSSLTRKHAGTGLGLSLCRRFVELHGGSIWVESEPGKGSTFSFIVPVR